jgi:hypothetical protein
MLVLLPGFQKGRDIKASQGKRQGAVLAKTKTRDVIQYEKFIYCAVYTRLIHA